MSNFCEVGGCTAPIHSLNMCPRHYARVKKYGTPYVVQKQYRTGPPQRDEIERFEKYVVPEPNSGCWLWEGGTNDGGYGAFRYRGRNFPAHRFSYLIHKGPLKDLFVCHHCDTPECVNPDHLFLGTTQDNVDDKIRKGRARAQVGADRHNTKFDEHTAMEIYLSPKPQYLLAEQHNVSRSVICNIKNKRTWKHIHREGDVST